MPTDEQIPLRLGSSASDFELLLNGRIQAIRDTLSKKGSEYSRNYNRYHNFDLAARILNTSPEQALIGMYIKHFVSILDIIYQDDALTNPVKIEDAKAFFEMLSEKITDSINYLILLEGIIRRNITRRLEDKDTDDE